MPIRTRNRIVIMACSALALIAVACSDAAAVNPENPGSTPDQSPGAIDAPVSEITVSGGRIWLVAPTGNHQQGWANLSDENGRVVVDINVSPSEPVAQPAHIHTGTCEQLGGIEHRLENVIGGHSQTEIAGLTIKDLASGELAINLHLSFADFATFTACGEIPALS